MASMQKKSLIATVTIFCCRFTGLLREIVFTSLFGATGALDAFLTAFRVPNMLRDMFAEGAMSQSFTVLSQEPEHTRWSSAASDHTQPCGIRPMSCDLPHFTEPRVRQH